MQRRIAAIGMFDGVHRGHQYLISRLHELARELGLRPAVVTFSSHPLATIAPKAAPRLITNIETKTRLIAQLTDTEVITLNFDEQLRQLSAREFLAMLQRDFDVAAILLGFNNRIGHDRISNLADYQAIGSSLGIQVFQADELPDLSGVSSSAIRSLIAQGRVTEAADLLSRPVAISGIVVHGQAIGRTIGFPTANIRPADPDVIIPARGVYAALLQIGENQYRAVVNIGTRPTIDPQSSTSSIEAHIIDFEGDIYNQPVELTFIARLRDEMRFDSIDALRRQILADRQAALATLC